MIWPKKIFFATSTSCFLLRSSKLVNAKWGYLIFWLLQRKVFIFPDVIPSSFLTIVFSCCSISLRFYSTCLFSPYPSRFSLLFQILHLQKPSIVTNLHMIIDDNDDRHHHLHHRPYHHFLFKHGSPFNNSGLSIVYKKGPCIWNVVERRTNKLHEMHFSRV